MADLTKHRAEVLKVTQSFTAALNSGDSVTAVSGIVVAKKEAGGWTDKSSDFGDPSGTRDGDTVDFTLGAAGADEQAQGRYHIRVTVTTTDGETLSESSTLDVTDTADPDAP